MNRGNNVQHGSVRIYNLLATLLLRCEAFLDVLFDLVPFERKGGVEKHQEKAK